MNNKQLLKHYQKLLGLQDWLVVLYDKCKPQDFTEQDRDGECEYNETLKTAIIRILDPIYYGERVLSFDFEKTLVHELLHIKFAFIDNSGNELQDRLVHTLINDLAKAIVYNKRNNSEWVYCVDESTEEHKVMGFVLGKRAFFDKEKAMSICLKSNKK